MTTITFFKRLAPQILSGKKTITIRDKTESYYNRGQILEAKTLEGGHHICLIEIISIQKVTYDQLNRSHAKAENLPFVFILKWMLRRIYPGEPDLYVLRFKVAFTNIGEKP